MSVYHDDLSVRRQHTAALPASWELQRTRILEMQQRVAGRLDAGGRIERGRTGISGDSTTTAHRQRIGWHDGEGSSGARKHVDWR